MRENELLRRIYQRSESISQSHPHVLVGPGDDCAVLAASDRTLVVGVDQLVLGRHATPETAPDLLARKALARSLSDIAAMGARPAWALATGTLPTGTRQADDLFQGLARWAEHWEVPLVGGDIASAPADQPDTLVLTTTVAGHCDGPPLLRSGALPGDAVYVTGSVGGSFQSGHHLLFEPRIDESLALRARLGASLHAMLDLSDGLGLDATRLAEASGVTVELDATAFPLRTPDLAWRHGAADGEDYELLFTTDHPLPRSWEIGGVPVTRVGTVRAGAGCTILSPDGQAHDGATMGWEHGA